MAFNAQFFQLNPTTNLADDIKGGYEAGLGIYKGEHEKKLNDIFSNNINAEGNLNEFNFYREASNAGLNPSQIGQAIDYHNKQIEQKTKIAENETNQRSLGYDPTAAGRNGATVSTSLPSSESKQNTSIASGQSDINVDKIPETQAEYDKVVAERAKNKPTAKEQLDAMFMKDRVPVPKENPVKIPVAQLLNQPANTINIRAEGKPTNTEEAKMSPDTIAPDVFANKDTRTFTQKFEDSYSKDNSILGKQGAGSDVLNPAQYEKMGGNKRYADQYLAKAGLPNGQAGLDKAFEIYKSSVKAPSVQGKDNKIDVFATIADQNRYNAELAETAKKFYQDIVTGNTTTIAEKVAQENLGISKQKLGLEKQARSEAHTEYEQTQDQIEKLNKLNLQVNKEQVTETIKQVGDLKTIVAVSDGLNSLANRKDFNTMSDDQFAQLIKPKLNSLAVIEKSSTEGGEARLMDGLRKNSSWGQLLKDSKGDWKEVVAEIAKRKLTAQDRKQFVHLLQELTTDAMESGFARSQLDAKSKDGKGVNIEALRSNHVKEWVESKPTKTTEGTKENPIPYKKGMETYDDTFYNVGGIVVRGKRKRNGGK